MDCDGTCATRHINYPLAWKCQSVAGLGRAGHQGQRSDHVEKAMVALGFLLNATASPGMHK